MKILVADNSFVHRATIIHALSKIDCESIEAANTEEAMRILVNMHIDAVIVHLSLPPYGGIDFLTRSKKPLDENNVCRILTMAYHAEDFMNAAIDVGVEGIIVYPLKEQEIIEKVNHRLSGFS